LIYHSYILLTACNSHHSPSFSFVFTFGAIGIFYLFSIVSLICSFLLAYGLTQIFYQAFYQDSVKQSVGAKKATHTFKLSKKENSHIIVSDQTFNKGEFSCLV